jgi:predicted ArsR family transcriptional regulator
MNLPHYCDVCLLRVMKPGLPYHIKHLSGLLGLQQYVVRRHLGHLQSAGKVQHPYKNWYVVGDVFGVHAD